MSWNWCWLDCLLLLPNELIMEDASLIPGSMEEKYWLAVGWMGTWIPDWWFELTMDVRSVNRARDDGLQSGKSYIVTHRQLTWTLSVTLLREGGKKVSSLKKLRPCFEFIAWISLLYCFRANFQLHCCCLYPVLNSDLSVQGAGE